MAFEHVSVLLNETVDGLNVKPDGVYVDATLGGGGHAYEVCRRLGSKGRFIGIDQDADAIKAAGERLKGFGEKVTIIRSNYRDFGIHPFPRIHPAWIYESDHHPHPGDYRIHSDGAEKGSGTWICFRCDQFYQQHDEPDGDIVCIHTVL